MSIPGGLLIGQHLRQMEKGEIQLFKNWENMIKYRLFDSKIIFRIEVYSQEK